MNQRSVGIVFRSGGLILGPDVVLAGSRCTNVLLIVMNCTLYAISRAAGRRRWPAGERAPVDRSDDPPGSWRGDGNRVLDRAVNGRVESACDRIAEREQERISPALRAMAHDFLGLLVVNFCESVVCLTIRVQ